MDLSKKLLLLVDFETSGLFDEPVPGDAPPPEDAPGVMALRAIERGEAA